MSTSVTIYELSRSRSYRHVLRTAALLLMCLVGSRSFAQLELREQRWFQAQTEHFTLISRQSSRQTERLAQTLESWRRQAALQFPYTKQLPEAAVPNLVFVFDNAEDLAWFTYVDASAFFNPSPRANFLAFVAGDEDSLQLGLHHYSHFLIRNFSPLQLPRWYEEGLATFVARLRTDGEDVSFEQYSASNNGALARVSGSFSMDRLLYRDQALASPRVIQIANLKAEALFYYLQYGFGVEGFADRRRQLQGYLDYLLEGRRPRFAFDQSFDVTTEQLDEELQAFLLQDVRPRVDIVPASGRQNAPISIERLDQNQVDLLLAELALNSGRPEIAEQFFRSSVESGQAVARSFSGLGDALRFQAEVSGEADNDAGDQASDQSIAAYFQQALDMATDDPMILLDYGEYWEAELLDCEKQYPNAQRQRIIADIQQSFGRALASLPDSPEANLAMAQLYLLEGLSWQDGRAYQQAAFELLPADSFIMEQAVRYAIEAGDFVRAEQLIDEMAQPIHFYGEPGYVADLRERLLRKRRGESYEACSQ